LNSATAPTSGQVLTASSSTAASWVTPSSGVTTYAALSDVQLTSLGNDQIMVYKNSSTDKWCNYTISGASFND